MNCLTKKASILFVALALALGSLACVKNTSGDGVPNAVHQAAVVSLDFGKTLENVQAAAIQANAQGALSQANTAAVVGLTVKLAQQGKAVNTLIAGQANLPVGTKTQVSAILGQLVADIQNVLNTDVAPITDQKVKAGINAGLTLAMTAIKTAQAAMGGQ